MATKKKVAKKKATSTSTARPRAASAAAAVSDQPVGELFSTQPQESSQTTVPKNSVLLFVKGDNKGILDVTGQTVGQFVLYHAQRAGIRTFATYLDGVKADTSQGGESLSKYKKVEIVPKDSRGKNWLTDPEAAGFKPIAEIFC